jgi:hypothetical protein
MRPVALPGSNRQLLTAGDGTRLQRRYLYLRADIWETLHALVRISKKNQSQILEELLAEGGRRLISNESIKEQ